MKGVLLVICFVVGLLPSDARDCEHQIVCQRLRQVAEHACATYGVAEGVVIGPKGEKGDRGEPAVVDYERIILKVEELYSQEIDALVIKGNETKEAIENLNKSLTSFAEKNEREINALMIKDNDTMAMIEKLNESVAILKEENTKKDQEIAELKSSLEKLISTVQNSDYKATEEFCKVYYGGKCFWYVHDEFCTYSEAEAICAKVHGGRPAVVYSAIHYEQLTTYIRSLIDYTYFWLGLKINPSTKEVTIIPEGTPAPFLKWISSYPYSGSPYTSVTMTLYKDPSNSNNGMMNNRGPTSTTNGVLCEA